MNPIFTRIADPEPVNLPTTPTPYGKAYILEPTTEDYMRGLEWAKIDFTDKRSLVDRYQAQVHWTGGN